MDSVKIADVLNDLIQINNDRIAGYEVALADLDEEFTNLRELFQKMISESKNLNLDLSSEIDTLNQEVATGTSGAGKLYRAWMDMKALITAGNVKNILNDCETIEAATQRAYEQALDEEGLNAHVHSTIARQKAILLESHNNIKHLLEIASSG